MKTRSLNEEETIAIEQYKLWNLKDYLGRRPDAEELLVLKSMFHDSLAGQPFDVASYGKYYRPFGSPNSDETKTDHSDPPFEVTPSTTVGHKVAEPPRLEEVKASNPHDILERIKNRTKAK